MVGPQPDHGWEVLGPSWTLISQPLGLPFFTSSSPPLAVRLLRLLSCNSAVQGPSSKQLQSWDSQQVELHVVLSSTFAAWMTSSHPLFLPWLVLPWLVCHSQPLSAAAWTWPGWPRASLGESSPALVLLEGRSPVAAEVPLAAVGVRAAVPGSRLPARRDRSRALGHVAHPVVALVVSAGPPRATCGSSGSRGQQEQEWECWSSTKFSLDGPLSKSTDSYCVRRVACGHLEHCPIQVLETLNQAWGGEPRSQAHWLTFIWNPAGFTVTPPTFAQFLFSEGISSINSKKSANSSSRIMRGTNSKWRFPEIEVPNMV